MEQRTTGLILRTRPLSETSLIVEWLTHDLGRISTVAKGARSKKSPFVGKLDLYYEADLAFLRSRKSELHILKEVLLKETHSGLRKNLQALNQAAYFGVLIEHATERDTPIPELYTLMRGVIKLLEANPTSTITALAFEMKVLADLGFQPSWEMLGVSKGSELAAGALLRADWQSLGNIKLSPDQELELKQALRQSILAALDWIPRQREAAFQIKKPRHHGTEAF